MKLDNIVRYLRKTKIMLRFRICLFIVITTICANINLYICGMNPSHMGDITNDNFQDKIYIINKILSPVVVSTYLIFQSLELDKEQDKLVTEVTELINGQIDDDTSYTIQSVSEQRFLSGIIVKGLSLQKWLGPISAVGILTVDIILERAVL